MMNLSKKSEFYLLSILIILWLLLYKRLLETATFPANQLPSLLNNRSGAISCKAMKLIHNNIPKTESASLRNVLYGLLRN